jgi:[protein-PII] uridylyltransferase
MDPATSAYRRKVQAHAARRLAALSGVSDPVEAAAQLRAFIKLEDERLKIAHRCGAPGSWTVTARSFALDCLIERIFQHLKRSGEASEALRVASSSFALIAIGGYGRRELSFSSDIDLLFLSTGHRRAAAKLVTEDALRLLWDAGLTVGHSLRTINETLAAARADVHLQTALFSSRLVIGSAMLFESFEAALEIERERRRSEIIAAICEEHEQRRRSFGAEVCVQEPHIKEGCGGLRDLHTVLWIARLTNGCRALDELGASELLSKEEEEKLIRARDFLLRVRCEAHLLGGRRADRLTFDLQPELAARLGYRADTHLAASEKFMRDYYRHALAISRACDKAIALATEKRLPRARWFLWRRAARPFIVENGRVYLNDEAASSLRRAPLLYFEAFARAQESGAELSHNLLQALEANLDLIDRKFRHSPEAAQAFLQILRRRGRVARALRMMRDTGFLSRYLPEFDRINLLIQHDFYHHYTIDEHTLKAIEALDELSCSQDEQRAHWRAVFDQIEDVALLYLAVLLHDFGKGRGRGHAARGALVAARVCRRLHLDPASSAKIVLLTKHHLLMAHLAQRRDLTDPRIVQRFAAQIESLDALNMLLLLTYADLHGVAPGVWSDWKGRLLWDLYMRARKVLTGEPLISAPSARALRKERVLALLQGEIPPSEIERHFALLPEKYALTFDAETIARHLRLIKRLDDVWSWQWRPFSRDTTELTICTRDRHALFADIAGALASHGIEILSAELNTREDGLVIDQFVLREAATHQAVEERRRGRIERALRAAIAGESDVAAQVERWRARNAPRRLRARAERSPTPRVTCDSEAAQLYTVLEVCVADEPGLAYRIARIVADLGFEIVCARISTEKHYALDVFYVTDGAGNKLSATQEEELCRALRRALAIEA